MKVYQFELENPHEERRVFPVSYLNFNHGLRCFFSAIKDDWRLGSIIEVFIANKNPRRLIFRIESRPEGDLISDFRKCPLKENKVSIHALLAECDCAQPYTLLLNKANHTLRQPP